MAKKKMTESVSAPSSEGRRRTVLTIKGTEEWREWLERFGKHARMPASTLVDHGLIDLAKKLGFNEEAPER